MTREESGRNSNVGGGIGNPLMRSQTGDVDIRNMEKDLQLEKAWIIAGDINITQQGHMSIMEKAITMGDRTVINRHER